MCEPHARDHLLNFVLIFENIRLYQRYLVKVVIDGSCQLLYIQMFKYFSKYILSLTSNVATKGCNVCAVTLSSFLSWSCKL